MYWHWSRQIYFYYQAHYLRQIFHNNNPTIPMTRRLQNNTPEISKKESSWQESGASWSLTGLGVWSWESICKTVCSVWLTTSRHWETTELLRSLASASSLTRSAHCVNSRRSGSERCFLDMASIFSRSFSDPIVGSSWFNVSASRTGSSEKIFISHNSKKRKYFSNFKTKKQTSVQLIL